jgi:hypothetical protein
MELDDGWKRAKEKKKKAYTAKRRERKKREGAESSVFQKETLHARVRRPPFCEQ